MTKPPRGDGMVARIVLGTRQGWVFHLDNGWTHKPVYVAATERSWVPGVYITIPEAIHALREWDALDLAKA